MKIKRIMIYFLVMLLMLTSLPVNMLTGAAQEVCLAEESDEVQTVEGQEESEEDLPEDCIVEEVIEFEETEAGAPESAEQELETETEVYPEIMIEEVAEVEGYDASVIASGSCGEDVTWELDASLNLVISGEGAMKDYQDCNKTDRAPWLDYLDKNFTLNSVTVEPGITRIGANAFGWCWINSTSMQLPDTLVEIGESAFRGCNNLSQILIPDSVTTIEDYAFAGTDLITMTIPDSVINIGKRILGECFILTSVKLPADMTEIPDATFLSCWELKDIEIPSGVTKIGENAFSGCKSITELSLPNGLTTIGKGSFGNCAGMRELRIPEKVTFIGDQAFFYINRFDGVDYGAVDIWFMGDMPEFDGTRVFTGAYGNLYYLSGAADTWTADLSNYGLDVNLMTVCSFGSGTCGANTKWSLGAGGVLTISGSGAMADYDQYSSTPWYVYADYINEIVIEDGITEIGDSCFTTLTHLKKVSFPSTLERIGQQAFWGCENLDGVVLPNTVKILDEQAFAYCDSLTSLVIPDGVAGEGGYLGGCLDCCISLSSVELPENLTIIPGWLFYGCSSLENINIPESVTVIGEYAFSDCTSLEAMVIPLGVTEIGEGAFLNCTNLKSVSDMGKVTEIGKQAFYACEALESITFPEGISCLNAYVLGRCSSLKEFTIPESVSCIGEGAFATSGLQKITIPKAVTEIKAAAFWQCGDLKEITFKGNLPAFTSTRTEAFVESDTVYPFQGLNIDCYYPIGASGWSQTQPADCGGTLTMLPYGVVSGNLERDGEVYAQWRLRVDDGAFVLSGAGDMEDFGTGENDFGEDRPWHDYKDLIKKVTIGGGITSIGNYAFYECENLKEVSLSDGLNFIGESAFELSGLTSVRLPDSVKEIDKYSFMTCENLQTADLGEGLETIGACAFAECGSLSSIIIPASVKTIGASAFHCSGLAQVLFKGDLPAVGNNAFSTMPSWEDGIKVEYPDDNETWSDLTQSSLGGSSEGGVFEFGEHTHDWGNGVQTSTPTCTDSGEKIYTCGICGRTKTETVSATGHSAGSWVTTKAATCTVPGTRVKKCTKCNATVSTGTIDAKGHSWSSWEVVASATVFDPQKEKRTCQTCKSTEEKTTGEKLQPTAELNYTNIPLQVGQSTTKIKVTGLAEGDSVKSWKSSKKSVATVNSKGKITGKKVGTATITVTLASGLTKKITVKVQKKAVKTTAIWIVGYSDFTLQKGKKFDLAASMKPYVTPVTSLEKITYSSSDEKILKVNSKGVVTAVGAGKAKIIIKSGKIKDYATFTVPKVKTTSISNVPEKVSLKKLKKYTIKAKLNPTDSDEKITYKSSNKKVATVNDKGVIRTWLKGTAKITVKSGSVKKVIKVTVK